MQLKTMEADVFGSLLGETQGNAHGNLLDRASSTSGSPTLENPSYLP